MVFKGDVTLNASNRLTLNARNYSATAGATVVHHDVTVTAPLDLAASMPEHASELYARNVVALLELMLDEHGALDPSTNDEVLVGACVTRSTIGEEK